MSNWLAIRTYRGTRLPTRHPLRYWRLEVYYYTGGVDPVPHVPETCAVAGGAAYVGTVEFSVRVPDQAPAPWGGRDVVFNRAMFEKTDIRTGRTIQYVQYYTFSLNGRPENSRSAVRFALASPFLKHAYFAKIQFAPVPVYGAADPTAIDSPARDFARHFLPFVLKALPMPADVEKLDAGR